MLLQSRHGLADAVRVLAVQQAAREAKQAAQLVVHLIEDMRRAVLFLGVCVCPGALERPADELAGAPFRLLIDRLLYLHLFFKSAREADLAAVPRPLAGRTV